MKLKQYIWVIVIAVLGVEWVLLFSGDPGNRLVESGTRQIPAQTKLSIVSVETQKDKGIVTIVFVNEYGAALTSFDFILWMMSGGDNDHTENLGGIKKTIASPGLGFAPKFNVILQDVTFPKGWEKHYEIDITKVNLKDVR